MLPNIANGDIIGDITEETTVENRILALLHENPAITASQLAEITGFSTRKVSRIVKNLRENDTIGRIGFTRKGYREIHE